MNCSIIAWEIIESRGRAGLGELEAEWRKLYGETQPRSCFQSFEAAAAYVDHRLAAPGQLRCLRLTDGRRTRALCLLMPQVERRLGLPVATWVPLRPHDHLNDFLCTDDEARRAFLPALAGHLRRRPEGRLLLGLGPLATDSPVWAGLARAGGGAACLDPRGSVRSLDCRRPFAELLAELSAKFRHALKSNRKRVEALEGARLTTVRESPGFEAELRTFQELEAAGWKGAAGTAILRLPGQPAYYSAMTSTLRGDLDHFELNALHAEGRCLASMLCARTGSTYTFLKTTYSEADGRLQPGQQLLTHVIERCCADPGIDRLDMVSDVPWVHGWRTGSVDLQSAYLNIGGWRGRLALVLLRLRFGPLRRLGRWLKARRAIDRDPGRFTG